MLYEIHMLKNYPPTNLNRDDSGTPKTCEFAGSSRARISSQCLKRSWRTSPLFVDAVGAENLGVRTRRLPVLVEEELLNRGTDPEWVSLLVPKLAAIGSNKSEIEAVATKQIVLYAPADIAAVTDAVQKLLAGCRNIADVKKLKAKDITGAIEGAELRPVTVDIALFGRMVTSDGFADVEAAMQVAHAISTNCVRLESDFFTAVDDLVTGDALEEQGSGMMGDIDYNSSCYYLYAAVDAEALKANLKNTPDAERIVQRTIPALLRTMALVNPSGKQNTFAGHVLPSAVLVECKENKVPVSLVNAFAEPAYSDDAGDLVLHSIEKMQKEADDLTSVYGIAAAHRWWFTPEKYRRIAPSTAEVCQSFDEMLDSVAGTLETDHE